MPTQLAGAITIALIVGLGIFVYPWLLAQRHGGWGVAVMTLLLGGLFAAFQLGAPDSASGLYSVGLAALWALGPVIAGVVVWRLQRNTDQESAK